MIYGIDIYIIYTYRDIEHVSFFSYISCILYVSTLALLKQISFLHKVRASSTPPAFLRNDVDEDVHEAGGVRNLHPAGTWGNLFQDDFTHTIHGNGIFTDMDAININKM